MTPTSINNGGLASLIRLPEKPILETETICSGAVAETLDRWQTRPGEVVTVCAPDGFFYRARVLSLSPSEVALVVFSRFVLPPESPLRIDLYQALPQRERFELILEKLTELGVFRIVPYCSRHSITLAERDARQRKSHRWPDLVLRAAKQCRRAMIPELFPVLTFPEALTEAALASRTLVLSEKEQDNRLREILVGGRPVRHVALMVGPEGGFSADEMAELKEARLVPVSLGGRILRTETAAMTGVALVQHLLGDLG